LSGAALERPAEKSRNNLTRQISKVIVAGCRQSSDSAPTPNFDHRNGRWLGDATVRCIYWILGTAVILGLAAGVPARADTAFYTYSYVSDQTSYTVATNSDFQVQLYLQEVSSTPGSSLLVNEDGLTSAGVSVSATASPSSPAVLTGVAGNLGTGGFEPPARTSFTSTSASILENTGLDSDGVAAGPQVGVVSEVLLGTLTVHAGSLPGQSTTFTVGPYAPDSGNTYTFNNFYDLDNNSDPFNPEGSESLYSSAAPTTFTVTTTDVTSAVPEPSSLVALCGFGAMGLFFAACRRRNA
jgi:hypothetical protein